METKDTINQRFKIAVNYLITVKSAKNKSELAQNLKLSKSKFSEILNGRMNVGIDTVALLCLLYEIRTEWLIGEKGKMIRPGEFIPKSPEHLKLYNENIEFEAKHDYKLIPFYEDVSTIGGISMVAETNSVTSPSDYINAGDWFPEATAAIRHYGDSMSEYPNGCILALKEIPDKNFIIWGNNYTIETWDVRITKRLQKGDDQHVVAYSSNEETYSDGRLVHEPIEIQKESIRKLFMVLGYVVKAYSSKAVNIVK